MSLSTDQEPFPVGERWVTTALSRRVPAGLVESALSSLATFLTGFLAVHYLTTSRLGNYALALSSFLLAGALTAVLAFTGVETIVVSHLRPGERASVIRRSLPKGVWVAGSFALAAGAAILLVPSGADPSERLALAASCVAAATVSPLQDHVRRMLHVSLNSWGAALVSVAQLGAAAVGAVIAVSTGLCSQAWAPFGVLALANAVSLGIGLVLVRGPQTPESRAVDIGLRRSLSFGKELAFAAIFLFGSNFAANAIVIGRAGVSAAGTAEAARVLAQPLTLIAVGLITVLGPDLMTAATAGNIHRLRQLLPAFVGVMTVISPVWALIAWRPWSWSPLPHVAHSAYTLPNLVLLTIPGQVLTYVAGFGLIIGQAVGQLGKLSALQVVSSGIGLVVVTVLARHGAWALAFSTLASGGLSLAACLYFVLGPRRTSLVPPVKL